jgi:tight adherence protein B
MATFLISFFAFMAVILFMLLLYAIWLHFFDRRTKAKNQRLQTIQDTIHSAGQSLKSAQTTQDSAIESWLRANSVAFGKLENLVRSAHSPLSAVRWVGVMLALFTLVLLLGLLRQANPLLLLVLAIPIAATPLLWLSQQADRRRRAFEDKLPEALDYISRALRAGQSLSSSIGMLGKEFPDPIGQEFKTVSDEMIFGIPFKDAIGQLADRVQSGDLNFFVISLMIQHETGGNLTELLDGLAKTMRERVKLRGKVRTLSSEGRASAWVLGSMPFVLVGVLSIINRDYVSVLWTTPQGMTLILIGGVLMALGLLTINRIIQIKV